MLTRAGYALLVSALGLVTLGLALGSPYHLAASLVPAGVFLAGVTRDRPHGVSATLKVSELTPRAGDVVRVDVTYEVGGGSGPVEFFVEVPDVFELAEGSNLHVVRKLGGKPLSGAFGFDLRCTKRGPHKVGPVIAEVVHPAGIQAPAEAEVARAIDFEVRPAATPIRRVRGLSGFAKQLFPENDLANMGIRTTDFREVREYAAGDPIKYVNWKATGRRAGVAEGLSVPLVNEYEREGKKAVWLFVDAAPYMRVGTTATDSFEHAIAAANALAQFYLERGYRLGASVYNHGGGALLRPDTGRRQRLKLHEVLTHLQTGAGSDESLLGAVEKARRFLAQEKPLVIVVTRLGRAGADERTYEAVKKVRSLSGRRRRSLPLLLVSVVAQAAIPTEKEYDADVVEVLRGAERPRLARARRMGARVVEWDPSKGPLETLLLRAGGARR